MTDDVEHAEEMPIPLVCRSCSRVEHVPLTRLRATTTLRCGACGTAWDAIAISATIPARIVRTERARVPTRPLSEFP